MRCDVPASADSEKPLGDRRRAEAVEAPVGYRT